MRCDHCGKDPALPGQKLCFTCKREVEFWEQYDNIRANEPTCSDCGGFGHDDCLSQGIRIVSMA